MSNRFLYLGTFFLLIIVVVLFKPVSQLFYIDAFEEVEVNEFGDFIYLQELLPSHSNYQMMRNYKPVSIMTYDIDSQRSWELLELEHSVKKIDYDRSNNYLAVEVRVKNESVPPYRFTSSPMVVIIDLNREAIIKKITFSELLIIEDGLIAFENGDSKYLMDIDKNNTYINKGKREELPLSEKYHDYILLDISDRILYIDEDYNSELSLMSKNTVNSPGELITGEELIDDEEVSWNYVELFSEDKLLIIDRDSTMDYTDTGFEYTYYTNFYIFNILDKSATDLFDVNSKCGNTSVSTDGKRILYEIFTKNSYNRVDMNIHLINIDGSGGTVLLNSEDMDEYSPIWVR